MKHAFGLNIPQTVEDAIRLDSTALIVYDMQVGLIGQMKNGSEVLARVASVLDVARDVGLRTFFLRHPQEPDGRLSVAASPRLAAQGLSG
jgi:nicotinamidase-related amidase